MTIVNTELRLYAEKRLTPVVTLITVVSMSARSVIKPTSDELRRALLANGGSVTQAATELGVHRVTVHKWMREYGIGVQRIVTAKDDLPNLVA